jgi:two-component system, chemotaxis family, sensor kinase Cph1
MTTPDLTQAPDLTICDREPIHIPGRIQPHGVLIALSEPDLQILQVSVNCADLLGQTAEQLLGQPLAALLDEDHIEYLRRTLAHEDLEQNPLYIWTAQPRGTAQQFDGLLHRNDGLLILELELARPAQEQSPDFYRLVKRVIARIQRAPSFAAFCDAAASETRALTGFDRVMIYQFDSDGHGTVIAEALADGLAPYLGLHYPASDIPQQARALYLRNWLRLIPDARYAPADIVPTLTPGRGGPIDLSHSILRSVSPVHLEYLANMGVAASMSISLVKDGALWGLIACHHSAPHYVSYEVRAACEFLGQAVSLQLAAKQDAESYAYRERIKTVSAQMTQRMAEANPWYSALVTGEPTMLSLFDASGAALCYEDTISLLGVTPDEADVRALVGWLSAHADDDIFVSASAARDCPALAHRADVASGVLAAPISRELGEYLIWFRPEVVQTVHWGGEPTKAVVASEDGLRLSPRKSFERWQELVAQQSIPWAPVEIEAASELRNAIQTVVLRRAAELTRLNADLERSNIELDAFAYIASHDLKEPLRGLHNYAYFLLEDYREQIDDEGRAKLQTMIRLTQRMDALIDSLLHYSRVGRVDLAVQETPMDELLHEILETLALTLSGTEVRMIGPLPTLRCDRVRIREVFQNLISNATKYNTRPDKWIEIGYIAPDPHESTPRHARLHTFYVRDNGIGVQEKHVETIFRIFKRLHGRDQFGGGTGAGLTIAKKIVERHGGTIWVESTYGEGSTFFFTMQELA